MSLIQNVKRYLGLEPIEEKLQRFEEIQKAFTESDLQLDELAKDFFIEKSLYSARMKDPDNYVLQPRIQEKFDIFIKGHKESIRKAKKQFDSLKKEKDEIEKAFSNHKYIRKEPDNKGGWNYVYEEGGKKEKEVNFKYSLEVNGIDFVTNHSQTYADENLSPFESRGSFKATIRKSDLINIAAESEALSSLGITYDDSIKSVCEKLKKKGIHQIEIFKNKLVFEMRPVDLSKSILGDFGDQCISTIEEALKNKKETAYSKIKKAYQHGQISLDSFNTIIKGLTKDEKTKYSDFLLFNENGELLLLKRSSWEDDNAGAWVIPGGHVDPGEDFKTAAIRELQEESGYNVEDAENVGSYEDDKCHIEYFQAYVNTGEKPIALQFAEVRDYKWIPVNEICEEAMVFNMRDNVLKILGIEDQDKHKKIIRKAILAGIIPVGLISKALNKDYKKLLLQIKERQGKLEKSDFLEVWRKFNTSKNREGIEEFDEYTNHYNLKDLPFWPQGLDLENCEVVYIDKEKVTVIAGGDWQDGKYVTISLANSSNGEGLELEVIGVSDEKPKGQTARERQKFYKENGLSKFETVDVEKAYLLGLIPDDLIEKAWKKQPTGTVTTRKDGQQYRKVAETGNMDQDWKLVVKDKAESGKPESKGNSEAKQVKEGNQQFSKKELEIHAKNASESTLQAAIHESADENVRTAAHNEIDRREKEEKPQEKEKGEEKKENKVSPQDKFAKETGKDYVKESVAKLPSIYTDKYDLKSGELKSISLDKLKPTQEGEDRKNASSEAEAEVMQQFLDGEIEANDVRKDDFYPIVVDADTMEILDGNHRFSAYEMLGLKKVNVVILQPKEKEEKPIKKGGFEQWL